VEGLRKDLEERALIESVYEMWDQEFIHELVVQKLEECKNHENLSSDDSRSINKIQNDLDNFILDRECLYDHLTTLELILKKLTNLVEEERKEPEEYQI